MMRELPRVVELEAGDAFSTGGDCRLREYSQLAAVDEGLDNVLLDVQVVVDDRRETGAQVGQVGDGFLDAVVGDVVGRRLGSQDQVIAHVLFDEAVAIVAADHRVGRCMCFDFGLQLAVMELGDFAAEDGGDLVWLADGPVGVEEPLAELVERGAAMEDQVVAELDLGEEQAVLAAGMLSLGCG